MVMPPPGTVQTRGGRAGMRRLSRSHRVPERSPTSRPALRSLHLCVNVLHGVHREALQARSVGPAGPGAAVRGPTGPKGQRPDYRRLDLNNTRESAQRGSAHGRGSTWQGPAALRQGSSVRRRAASSAGRLAVRLPTWSLWPSGLIHIRSMRLSINEHRCFRAPGLLRAHSPCRALTPAFHRWGN